MPNNKNKNALEDLNKKVSESKSIILTETKGIKANDLNELRSKIREVGAELSVTKNTLLKIALEKNAKQNEKIETDLKGQTTTIFSYKDSIAPIKVILEFTKRLELPKMKSAIIDGKYTSQQELEVISTLPSKEQLLAQVLSGLRSPLYSTLNIFSGAQKKFLYALAQVAKQKEA